MDIAYQRLRNQGLGGTRFNTPEGVVDWLGAVQAQDYYGALWGLGLRVEGATEEVIEKALLDRKIVRTWPMRGTLHFVPAADVRWMLKLLTARVLAKTNGRHRQLELDAATFARSEELFRQALEGGRQLTRGAMRDVLEAGGVSTAGQRGIHILGHLAQEGVLCHGAREGKQQTFALLDEWIPEGWLPDRDEALAELARRYFTSRGPATVQDFAWWSGLTMAEAREGLEGATPRLASEQIDGQTYWSSASISISEVALPAAFLLPAYDEYAVAYRDRSVILDPDLAPQLGNGIFSPIVVVNGRVVGTWRRRLKKDAVSVDMKLLRDLNAADRQALDAAVERYAAFLGRKAALKVAG